MAFHRQVSRLIVLASSMLLAQVANAHCDSLDGPVIQDARLALEKRDATPVLKWVEKEHEPEIRGAFKKTLAVRQMSEDAKQLADQFFFETLVRIHRAGEGEAFTGLKPAGSIDPGIAAADKALESGAGMKLADELSEKVKEGVRHRFETAVDRKKHVAESIEAGRKYVEAYVDYIHFVENVDRLTQHGAPHAHHNLPGHAE